MILVMTCLCRATSAVEARLGRDDVWGKSVLTWDCPACGDEHRFEVPEGQTYLDLEAQSLRLLGEEVTALEVDEYARGLKGADPGGRVWVRLGRLVRAWRGRAGLTQEAAAAKAGISSRDYKRIEAGESRKRIANAERAVRAVGGSMGQLYLLVAPDMEWEEEFAARLKRALKQFSGVLPVMRPADDALMPADLYEDAAAAVRELGRALVATGQADAFLFLAAVVHETYWLKRLGGFASPDELPAKLIPPVKDVIDLLKSCRSGRERQSALRTIEREMEAFLTREQLFELGTQFLLDVREETALPEPAAARLGLAPFEPLTKYFTPREGLLLSMFDGLPPERQTALLAAFKRLHARARKDRGGGR